MSNDFDEALESVLDNYATDLRTAINADTEAAAQRLKKAISAEAPVKTGKQKKSWRITKEYLGGVDLNRQHMLFSDGSSYSRIEKCRKLRVFQHFFYQISYHRIQE